MIPALELTLTAKRTNFCASLRSSCAGEVSAMVRKPILVIILLLVPTVSGALQLQWAPGTSHLNFSQARRCTLMVSSGPEEPLPGRWQLVWVAGSGSGRALAVRAETTTDSDTARVCGLTIPSNSPEAAANQLAVELCSGGGGRPHIARYIIDISADTHAKFLLVAARPTGVDSSAFNVEASNEVTINDGVNSPYPPTILRAAVSHGPLDYEVSAIGLGLAAVDGARLEPADATWNAPLAITAQTDTSLNLTLQTSARLPATFLQVAGAGATFGCEQLPPDQESPSAVTAATAYYSDPQTVIPNRPKDFAFLYDGIGHFHLFYIKHNLVPPEDDAAELKNEKTLGHTWSEDLLHWAPADTQSFRVRPGFWDALHVWAPSIIPQGPTYYLFYTGVDAAGNQKIGVAKTNNLAAGAISWIRPASWVLSANMTIWADTLGTGYGNQQQFRDPFVMADPSHPGQYLMYYVAELAAPDPYAGRMVVGVARSVGGNLEQWVDIGPLRITSFPYSFNPAAESPHVFSHLNSNHTRTWWWLFYSPSHLEFATTTNGPADLDPASWASGPTQLSFYLEHGANVPVMPTGYVGSEYLQTLNREFFAAYTDSPGQIVIWDAYWISQAIQDSVRLRNLQVTGVDDLKLKQRPKPLLALSRLRPGEGYVELQLDLPAREMAHLDIIDVLGRRVKCVVNRELLGGVTNWQWDGSNEAGARVGSGVYFARLSCAAGHRTVRMPFIR